MPRTHKLQDLIEQIAADLLNGKMRHEVLYKIMEGLYEGQETKYTNERSAMRLIAEAYKNFKFEIEQNRDEMRMVAYNRMLSIYEDSVSSGDRTNALKSLEMMNKLFGLNEPDKLDVNGKINVRKVNIKFGVSNDNVEDEN